MRNPTWGLAAVTGTVHWQPRVRDITAAAMQLDIRGAMHPGLAAGVAAGGKSFGFCAWTLIRILRGRFREVNWMVYALTALFAVRFYYLGSTK